MANERDKVIAELPHKIADVLLLHGWLRAASLGDVAVIRGLIAEELRALAEPKS